MPSRERLASRRRMRSGRKRTTLRRFVVFPRGFCQSSPRYHCIETFGCPAPPRHDNSSRNSSGGRKTRQSFPKLCGRAPEEKRNNSSRKSPGGRKTRQSFPKLCGSSPDEKRSNSSRNSAAGRQRSAALAVCRHVETAHRAVATTRSGALHCAKFANFRPKSLHFCFICSETRACTRISPRATEAVQALVASGGGLWLRGSAVWPAPVAHLRVPSAKRLSIVQTPGGFRRAGASGHSWFAIASARAGGAILRIEKLWSPQWHELWSLWFL
jgi:hypothetical protein